LSHPKIIGVATYRRVLLGNRASAKSYSRNLASIEKRAGIAVLSGLIPSLFIISQARCNVVVAPGRILRINGLVLAMLFCLLLGVVVPRVGALIR
jgi:hypothetical protein